MAKDILFGQSRPVNIGFISRRFFVKKIVLLMALWLSGPVWPTELITIRSPYDQGHPGNPALTAIILSANNSQNTFRFQMVSNPGAQGVIALNQVDPARDLALIHASFVQNSITGAINEKDWRPVGALGDACFMLISQRGTSKEGVRSLGKVSDPLLVGIVGLGSAFHLAALEISRVIERPIDPVLFKSAGEAVLTLIAEDKLTLVPGNDKQWQMVSAKKPAAAILGVLCPDRHPDFPDIKTLAEQGIRTPFVFNILVAHRNMSDTKREAITKIWQQAVQNVGRDKIFSMGGFIPPNTNTNIDDYYRDRVLLMQAAIDRHKDKLTAK